MSLFAMSASYAYNGTLQLCVSNERNAVFELTSPMEETFSEGGVYTVESYSFVGGALLQGYITVSKECSLTIMIPLGKTYHTQTLREGKNALFVFVPTTERAVQIYITVV